jgi:hypothetical protein
VLNPGGMRSRRDADRAWQGARLRPPLWILLAGVIAIGIVIGLSATSFTIILLSSFGAQAANPADVSALPHWPTPSASIASLRLAEITRVGEVGHEDISKGGRYDEF